MSEPERAQKDVENRPHIMGLTVVPRSVMIHLGKEGRVKRESCGRDSFGWNIGCIRRKIIRRRDVGVDSILVTIATV